MDLACRVVVNNGLAIDHRILAEDGVGDIVVFAFVARFQVGAIDQVPAGAAPNLVVVEAASERVVAGAPEDLVVAVAVADIIVAAKRVDHVAIGGTREHVVVLLTLYGGRECYPASEQYRQGHRSQHQDRLSRISAETAFLYLKKTGAIIPSAPVRNEKIMVDGVGEGFPKENSFFCCLGVAYRGELPRTLLPRTRIIKGLLVRMLVLGGRVRTPPH
jgi:hypothetical protein